MKSILTIIFIIILNTAFGNSVVEFYKSRDNLTIHAFYEREQDSILLDRFFDLLKEKLNRKNYHGHILLLIDCVPIQYKETDYKGNHEDFTGIGLISYDVLRFWDFDFLSIYHKYRKGIPLTYENEVYNEPPSEKYKIDLPEPININSSFDETNSQAGLKIMYNSPMWFSLNDFDKIYTYAQYALDNINKVMANTSSIIMKYEYDSFDVSIKTLDTNLIKSLPVMRSGLRMDQLNKNELIIKRIVIVFLIAFGGTILYRKVFRRT
jgi:hypothetical protein